MASNCSFCNGTDTHLRQSFGYHIHHIERCIHFANECLYKILSKKSKLAAIDKSCMVVALSCHKAIRKNYIFKSNNTLFRAFINYTPNINNIGFGGYDIILRHFMCSLNAFKTKQYQWITINEVFRIGMSYGPLPDLVKVPYDGHFANFLYAYNSHENNQSTPKEMNQWECKYANELVNQYVDDRKMGCAFANHLEKLRDMLIIKCGNIRCTRDYCGDTYGMDTFDDMQFASDEDVFKRPVSKRKDRIQRWKICKGCRSTYFCSRKCQKIAWVKFDHKGQCKKLQKLVVR